MGTRKRKVHDMSNQKKDTEGESCSALSLMKMSPI